MIFHETRLQGAFTIEIERFEDHRGSFARTFCRKEFEVHGLEGDFVQANVSVNHAKGTLRGMHYQLPPFDEVRLVRCSRGALYDVMIDLRPDSPTRGQWFATELSQDNGRAVFVPRRFAHGFITLADNTEAVYFISQYFAPQAERGIRHDDPQIAVRWPIPVQHISDKDRSWPDYQDVGATV